MWNEEKSRWSEVLEVFSEGWAAAPREVRKATLKICVCLGLIVGVLVFGATSSCRNRPEDAPGGIKEEAQGKVVTGWVAFKQEDLVKRRWAIAIVWGEAWSEWRRGRRSYVARGSKVQLLKGSKADEFTGILGAAGLETSNALRVLKANDVIRLHMDAQGVVTAVEVVEKAFRVPYLEP